MRLDNYTKEMMDENSFIDMSHIYLEDVGKDSNLYDMIDKFKEIGNYTESEIENRILQFYTDLNTDGQIGRASCRERVSMSAVAVPVKKKKKRKSSGLKLIETEVTVNIQ